MTEAIFPENEKSLNSPPFGLLNDDFDRNAILFKKYIFGFEKLSLNVNQK